MLPFFERKDAELFVYEYAEFAFPAHFHPSIEVIVPERGQIKLVMEGNGHILQKGDIGIIFPGIVHHYEYIPNTNSKGYLILIGKQLMGEYNGEMENCKAKSPVLKCTELDTDALNALEKLRHMQESNLRGKKAYAKMFLFHLFEKIELSENADIHEDILYRLVDYMEKHFTEDITLETTAEALYISKYTLSRVFGKSLGQSYNDYLNNLRVRYVIEKMENGERISEAAFDAGFNNLRTFNRAFKKVTNLTPREYKMRQVKIT
ncbi:MAG: helix-turn-helix domain-containing protein [Clostridia bacterium]